MTEEQKRLVEQNHNLIYSYIHRHKLQVDEMYGCLALAMCRAAISYDASKAKFTTYLWEIFDNEVKMRARHESTTKRTMDREAISIEAIIYEDPSMSKVIRVKDMLQGSRDIEETVLSDIRVNEYLSVLKPRDRQVADLRMQGYKQEDIAKIIGVSQVQVSRILNRIKQTLQTYEKER